MRGFGLAPIKKEGEAVQYDPVDMVVGWLIHIGTGDDEGKYVFKTCYANGEGKMRREEMEYDYRLPRSGRNRNLEIVTALQAVLSIMPVNQHVAGVGMKVADDVYWMERSYADAFDMR